ncbi:hypothetical protein Pla52n_46950 [Stieleria varia]|uniref:Uncharacterized protein n=1 Tax=Stieleria varia TaxID=2528005 RepID=A0A5C6APH0_9BACT|nr:hypothetical protein Pla52n_46950 [Stieleria varia]
MVEIQNSHRIHARWGPNTHYGSNEPFRQAETANQAQLTQPKPAKIRSLTRPERSPNGPRTKTLACPDDRCRPGVTDLRSVLLAADLQNRIMQSSVAGDHAGRL